MSVVLLLLANKLIRKQHAQQVTCSLLSYKVGKLTVELNFSWDRRGGDWDGSEAR